MTVKCRKAIQAMFLNLNLKV